MGIYLLDHPPARDQYRSPRSARPTGLTVIHTAEGVLDTVGPDTSAENVAAFIQRRTTAGSYHDLVDRDSALQLVRYGDEAYQDGTGSNPYALSISFALTAADWPRLTPGQRAEFLEQGAVAFARQQAWLRANGYPTTPLRRVTRAQSDAGAAGFISHAERDPARRTDPGAGFPWAEFFDTCRAATQEDDAMSAADVDRLIAHIDARLAVTEAAPNVPRILLGPDGYYRIRNPLTGVEESLKQALFTTYRYAVLAYLEANAAKKAAAGQTVNVAEVAAALAPMVVDAVVAAIAEKVPALTAEQVSEAAEDAVRRVLGSLDQEES